jgi:acyl carrier protein
VADLSGHTFDTVVLNSVVQYFPNQLYFEEVIARLLPLLEDGGRILIGDVRNLDLLSAHLCAVERSRASGPTTAGELAARMQHRRRQESELLFSPTYFARLTERFPELGAIDLMVKRGVGGNEMLAYRYDVVLTKGATDAAEPLPWLDAATPAHLRALLDGGTPERFGVSGLTNPRIADDVRISDGLARWSADREVEPLPKGSRLSASAADEVRELEAALRRAEDLGYRVSPTWSQDRRDGLDLTFGRGELPRVQPRAPYREARLANFPRIGDLGPSMARTLKEHLSASLPDYMVPAAFVLVEEIPLTPNGKVDKRALPAPDDDGVAKEVYVAPRTEAQQALCRLMGDVLGLSRVGIRDKFFDLGGHSLVAVRLTMRVKNETGRDLPLQLLLTGATVEEIAAVLEQGPTSSEPTSLVPATAVQDGEEAPLALQQKDLWFLDRPEHLGMSYDNVQFAFRIEGRLDREAYARSVQALVERHAVLRTSYVRRNGTVTQRVNDGAGFAVSVTEVGDDVAVAEWLRAEKVRPFAPGDRYMLRVNLLALSNDEHVVAITRPWGIFDGWSVSILLKELRALYRALSRGRVPDLPLLPLQYADFARWQRRVVDDAELDRQRKYWRRQLAGMPACSSLRTDYPRCPVKSYQGSSVKLQVPLELLNQLRALSQRHGATLYMTLLSAFAVMVGGHSEDGELAIGSPFTNRPRAELEQLVGYFVNHLAMRLNVTPGRAFTDVLAQARHVTAEAHEHKDLPFVDLVRALVPEPDPAYSPLFQVMFNLLPAPAAADDGEPEDLAVVPMNVHSGTAKFDLSLTVQETASGLRGSLEYSTDLFARTTAERMAQSFERLLEQIAEDPESDVTRLWSRANPSEVNGVRAAGRAA